MMAFDELMATDPPRLVVTFGRDASGQEQWSTAFEGIGAYPPLTLIGAIGQLQHNLHAAAYITGCPEPNQLVLAWDRGESEFRSFLGEDVPHIALGGLLETVKAQLVAGQVMGARQQAARGKPGVFGPDGQPFRRG